MKSYCLVIIQSFLFYFSLSAQIIIGEIVDLNTSEPLVYACVGIPETSIGTITDENGNFKIDVSGQPLDANVKFSLISYNSVNIKIGDLLGKENIIKLIASPKILADLIIKPTGGLKIVGNPKFDRAYYGGWPGSEYGKGYESGLLVKLGHDPVKLLSMHINVYKQTFDTSIFRLHVRSISKKLPSEELLNDNIYVVISKNGLVEIDLSKYNLIFKGEVVISLEWIKVIGIHENEFLKFRDGISRPIVFFNWSKKGFMFTKRGIESGWIRTNGNASIYFTVQK